MKKVFFYLLAVSSLPVHSAADASEFDPLNSPKPKKRLSLTIPTPVGSPAAILFTPPQSPLSVTIRPKIKRRVPSMNRHLNEPTPATGHVGGILTGAFVDHSADHSPVQIPRSLVIKSLSEINGEKTMKSIHTVFAAMLANNKIHFSLISLLEREALALTQTNAQFIRDVQILGETKRAMEESRALYFSYEPRPKSSSDDDGEESL